MNKTLMFLIFGFGCIWLVLDQIYGKKLIGTFVSNILPD